MSNRHTATGRFVAGKSTGVYRGAAKHDPSTEEIKMALHTKPSRDPVTAHGGVASVNANGAAPHAHDTAGPNAASNAKTNAALAHAGRAAPASTNAAQDVAAGLTGRQFAGLQSPED